MPGFVLGPDERQREAECRCPVLDRVKPRRADAAFPVAQELFVNSAALAQLPDRPAQRVAPDLEVSDQRDIVAPVRALGVLSSAGDAQERKGVRRGAVVVSALVGNLPRDNAASCAELLGGKTIHGLPPIQCAGSARYSGGVARCQWGLSSGIRGQPVRLFTCEKHFSIFFRPGHQARPMRPGSGHCPAASREARSIAPFIWS